MSPSSRSTPPRAVHCARRWSPCRSELAQAIVRDGEGATKFITVRIDGGRDKAECRLVAYAIAHSPLVKTAFFASDPNLGRILAAVGYAGIGDLDQGLIDLFLDDVHVVERGGRRPEYREEDGQRVLKQSEITVRVNLQPRQRPRHGLDLRPLARLREHQRGLPELNIRRLVSLLPRLPPKETCCATRPTRACGARSSRVPSATR